MQAVIGRSAFSYPARFFLDGLIILASLVIGLLLRFDSQVPVEYYRSFGYFAPVAVAVYCASNYGFGVYRQMWRYASASGVILIFASVTLTTGVLLLVDFDWPTTRPLPLTVIMMGGMITLVVSTAARYRWRLVTGFLWRWRVVTLGPRTKVLVVGAGEAGQLLCWQLTHQSDRYEVVGFIDDDPAKKGRRVHGARVLGSRLEIERIAEEKGVEVIMIAIHTLKGADQREIIELCQNTEAQVKILPNLFDVMDGWKELPMRDVQVDDLLGRQPNQVDFAICQQVLSGKTVMVTGAGGSIGSELCRQIVKFKPRALVALDNNETALHELGIELQLKGEPGTCHCVLADIMREEKMTHIFEEYRPQVIFHCAAYKHVPILETFVDEAVLVNVQGTKLLQELAQIYRAERFVFVSTDKAVAPVSFMGMTKRIGEMMMISAPTAKGTCFTAVRFGNVLNSRGSVIPTFLKQIQLGGPVTVTHPDMTRFFMGIPEAVSLVIQAAAFTKGSDIFMLNMGDEIKIVDLARKLIRMQGMRVTKDIEIVYSGVRPGERLFEELTLPPWEEKQATGHPSIFQVRTLYPIQREPLMAQVERLVALARQGDLDEVTGLAQEMVKMPNLTLQADGKAVAGVAKSNFPTE
ncbi:MAG: polysaccharide biosynthesis protein [Chloroflexi bacterium]|nr:polysaccharide biosynthesis protein [Chloroflexota bacterium]